EDNNGLPEPIYDAAHDTYRCTECAWEIIEGFCEGCQMEFFWDKENEENSLPVDSLFTEASNDCDRVRAPRGTTPLRDVGPFRALPGYSDEEYEALLQRGATRLMIETFNLEYSHASGIFAWADPTLYAEFAGPKMLKGHFWKIQLGRRFYLDDDDLDGASFVEGIIEEGILYPGTGKSGKWETVLDAPGIWVTRMAAWDGMDEDEDEDGAYDDRLEVPFVDDGPVLTCPGYETVDDSDSESEMVVEGDDSASNDVDMDEDTGAEIQASVPDGVYPDWDSRESTPEGAVANPDGVIDVDNPAPALELGVDGQTDIDEKEETSTLQSDSDSVDSDFDDDEELSGDEVVIENARL
ncbi:hypothetical protein FPV67DRAFT_1436584, partial [Lyophyllum atratum]